jgi:hypothetical protein
MKLTQIVDVIDIGLLILDKDCRVFYWNRWLASHSGIPFKKIKGALLFDFFPHLNNKKFLRNFQAILTFGNSYFFPRKHYDYIFPFNPSSNFANEIDYMQQNCVMGALRGDKNEIKYVYMTVKDVTETHLYETKLTSALHSLVGKNVSKKGSPRPKHSVLDDLLIDPRDGFLARHVSPQKSQKDIEADIDEQIDEILDFLNQK